MARALGLALAVGILAVFVGFFCIHVTPARHTSVMITFGQLEQKTYPPGMHLKNPFSSAYDVKTQLDVDAVMDIVVGAADGTTLYFPIVEVGNMPASEEALIALVERFGPDYDRTIIYDQVRYAMSTICSKMTSHEIAIEMFDQLDDLLMEELVRIQNDWDTNVNIVNVRIYKPKLPEALEQAYAHQAEEKAQKKVELEKYSRIQQQNNNLAEETRGRLEREAAEYAAIVAKDLASQEGELKQKAITNEILVAQAVSQAVIVKTQAEAKYFADQKQAEANKLLFTPQYIQLQKASAISSNAKIIAGDLGKAILTFQDIPAPCSGEGCEIAFGSN